MNKKKILILDDEPFNIDVLMNLFGLLELEGFPDSVDFFYDARDALKSLKASIYVDPESG